MKPGNRLMSTVLILATEMLSDEKLFFRKPLLMLEEVFSLYRK